MTAEDVDNVAKQQLPLGRDLKMRYMPRARIRPVYLQAAPWLDLLFILFFLVLIQSRFVLRPGVVVALPVAASQGIQGGVAAVLVPEAGTRPATASLFFADEVYRLDDQQRVEALAAILSQVRGVDQVAALTLYADSSVPQSYVVQVMDLAAQAGFDYLNLGTAPATPPAP